MITLTTKTGEDRFTRTFAPTDAALATWSIEARNAYLDEIAAEADLRQIEHDRKPRGYNRWHDAELKIEEYVAKHEAGIY